MHSPFERVLSFKDHVISSREYVPLDPHVRSSPSVGKGISGDARMCLFDSVKQSDLRHEKKNRHSVF